MLNKTFRILASLDSGKTQGQSGWARDADYGEILEFSDFDTAEAHAIELHTNRPSSRITYAVEDVTA